MKLQGKVAIVTGAGRGIGEDDCSRLSDEGAKVIISDVDMPAAESTALSLIKTDEKPLRLKPMWPTKPKLRPWSKMTIDKYGRLDILVNNAGMAVAGASVDLEEERWRPVWMLC